MNRKYTLLFLLIFVYQCLLAQTLPRDTAQYPYWFEMAQDPNANYYQTVRAFEIYWKDRPVVPHSGYKVFLRWQEYWSHHIDAFGNREPADMNMKAWMEYNGGTIVSTKTNGLGNSSGEWKSLGPHGNPTFTTPMAIGNGRINTFTFHPTDSNQMIIGAPQGGAWLTTDGCQSWTPLTDDLPTLGVSAIVWDYSNTNTILLGTGDRDFGDAPGLGVYKSTDGGHTWIASNTGFIGVSDVYALAQNPLNPNAIIASTNSGLFYSSNKGNTWTSVWFGSKAKDVKFKPGDTSIVYAAGMAGYFFRSTDGGQSWMDMAGLPSSGLPPTNQVQRYMLSVSKAAPNVVCLIGTNGSIFRGFYVSTNNGVNFRTKATTPNILGYNEDGSDNGGQAMYDLSIAMRQDSANVVFVGGINIFQSRDTGATWDCIGHWVGSNTAAQVHGDQHWMDQHPITKKMMAACDGGLYMLQPDGKWLDKNSNMCISQIYRIGQSPHKPDRVIAGFQDNGTSIYEPRTGKNSWINQIQADGMECLQDPKDTGTWYGCVYYGNIYKNGTVQVSPGAETGAWITPYYLHQDSNNIMFIAMKNIWRNRKINTTPLLAWEKLTNGPNLYINEMHSSRANPNILYFNQTSKLYRTSNCLAPLGSVRFDTLSPPVANLAFLDLESSFIDSNILYGVGSNNIIYISNDRGTTWTNYSNGLPTATKFCLLSDKNAKRGLYCGTFNGIFYRDSIMSSWVQFSSGLPVNAAVREMEYYYDSANTKDCRISACTYGRGLWQSPPFLQNTAPEARIFINDTNLCANTTYTLRDTSLGNPDTWKWTITPSTYIFVNGTAATSQFPQIQFTAGGIYSVKLFAKREGYGYSTAVKKDYLNVSSLLTSITPVNIALCEGSQTTLKVSGGNGVYSWSPATGLNQTTGNTVVASPSNTTQYYVYSGSGNCKDSLAFTVNVNPRPLVTVTNNTAICEGESIAVTANGATNYKWSPVTGLSADTGKKVVASPLVTTTYKVVGTTNFGCKDSATVVITVNKKPLVGVSPFNPSILVGQKVTLRALGASTYVWSPATGLNTTSGDTVIASPTVTTTYFVKGYAANNCVDSNFTIVNVSTTGISHSQENAFSLYPNPNDGNFIFQANEAGRLLVLSLEGKELYVQKISKGSNQLKLTTLSKGVYIIQFETESGKVKDKLVIE